LQKVTIQLKLGGSFYNIEKEIDVTNPPTIFELLRELNIPSSIVIARKDGAVVTENTKLTSGIILDFVKDIAVRDLTQIPETNIRTKGKPVYLRSILDFNHQLDTFQVVKKELNRKEYINYVEDTIIRTVFNHKMIPKDKKVGIGLSGGKDSVSMTLVLSKNKNKLKDTEFHAYTLEGWGLEQKITYDIPKILTKNLGIPHTIITKEDLCEIFNLNKGFDCVFKQINDTKKVIQNDKTLILAQMQRRAVESFAKNDDISTLYFGLNLDDLLSEMLLTLTTGHLALSLPVRKICDFVYCYPLSYLSKKEVNLYLELINKSYVKQEPVRPIERGAKVAHFYMLLAAHMMENWPGIQYQIYQSYSAITDFMKKEIRWRTCSNCGAAMLYFKNLQETKELCGACYYLDSLGLVK